MTQDYELKFNWKRVLIEGNPKYREHMIKRSPNSFSVNAAICEKHTTVHFVSTDYTGGIIEFMSDSFLRDYHNGLYNSCIPPGNISSLDFVHSNYTNVIKVACIPLNHILHRINVYHVNFFILDVEGGELEVLKSINWNQVRFDVLCIEVEEANRPKGFGNLVTNFMVSKEYHNVTNQIGRNIWFIRNDFVPSKRPGIHPLCFNGAERSMFDRGNRKTPNSNYVRCPMDFVDEVN